ncbi:sulfotransferase [Candidatus Parabeggiatoa sp. HSG14]|uniref:sulfotransferase n=1 Tax=Candidatus Parabeggiatoa sp. HSG14 TaxID=3055593 RepID=UPI0025A7FB6B|nr:sulfotransferase [Thiotrichales bacterium HSG14]
MKIIYIVGAGRSGTTILDILLGNGKDILSCGELNRFVVRNGVPTYWCHKKNSPTFLFWKNIKDQLMAKFTSGIDFSELNKISSQYEYHSGFFRKSANKKDFNRYSHFILKFYETLEENVEQSTIVDSSKYPSRALRLAKILPYEIKFVYLKRDPRGVVHSFSKKGLPNQSKPWLFANIFYFSVNFLCQRAVAQLKKKHQVVEIKYEDLITKPLDTLTVIQNELQIDLEPVLEKVRKDEFLTIGPLFEGSRIRMKEKLKLEVKPSVFPKTFKNFLTRFMNLSIYK